MSEKISLGVKLEPEFVEIFNKYGQLHGLNNITSVLRYIAATHCRRVLKIKLYSPVDADADADVAAEYR